MLAATPYLPTPPYAAPKQIVMFGHVTAMKLTHGSYTITFDPELYLSGKTASDYAFAKTGSRDVPNDHVYVDTHLSLTYKVPASAKATVMTNTKATHVALAALARAVSRNPGAVYWIVVAGDKAIELDQQYQP